MSDFQFTNLTIKRLAKLTPAERRVAMKAIGQMEFEKCADDVLYWLDPTKHPMPYVYTLDNHARFECLECGGVTEDTKRAVHLDYAHAIKATTSQSIKKYFTQLPMIRPFPLRDYDLPIIEAWLRYPWMVIEKSRDMMMTWLVVLLYTWDSLFHEGRQNIFQSQDAGGTAELVKRSMFVYDHQPAFLKSLHPANYTQGNSRSGQLVIPSLNSEILGFPQGPDQIRGLHPSGVFTDETAFQVEAEEGFAAIGPAINDGGRYTGVSTANPGFFQRLCRDQTGQPA